MIWLYNQAKRHIYCFCSDNALLRSAFQIKAFRKFLIRSTSTLISVVEVILRINSNSRSAWGFLKSLKSRFFDDIIFSQIFSGLIAEKEINYVCVDS